MALDRPAEERLNALVDVLVREYAPLPAASLATLVSRLRYAVPQWRVHLKRGLLRAKQRLSHAHVDGVDWYWATGEKPRGELQKSVRLLSPFDPIVWDRRRFEILWGWQYRFEAYTPAAKRVRGYYALPLLWRDQVVGWANLAVRDGELVHELGYVAGVAPDDPRYPPALQDELAGMATFLGL